MPEVAALLEKADAAEAAANEGFLQLKSASHKAYLRCRESSETWGKAWEAGDEVTALLKKTESSLKAKREAEARLAEADAKAAEADAKAAEADAEAAEAAALRKDLVAAWSEAVNALLCEVKASASRLSPATLAAAVSHKVRAAAVAAALLKEEAAAAAARPVPDK